MLLPMLTLDILNTVEELTSCRHIFSDRQEPAVCPDCSSELQLLDHGVICPNSCCDFRAGSILDLLPDAQEYVMKVYGNRHPAIRSLNWREVLTANSLQRELYLFFREQARAKKNNPSMVDSNFRRWLFDKGITDAHDSWWLLDIEQIQTIVGIFDRMGVEPPAMLDMSRPVAAIPFWGNHHAVSSVRFMGPRSQSWGAAKIRSFRHAFAGIHCGGVTINEDLDASSKLRIITHQFTSSAGHMASFDIPWEYLPIPKSLVSWDIRGLGDLIKKKQAIIKTDSGEVGWVDFLEDEITRAMNDGSPIRAVQTFLEAANMTMKDRQELSVRLENLGHLADARLIQETCLSTVIHLDDKYKIMQMPNAYHAGRISAESLIPISNFIWIPESVLLFDDSPVWISGQFQSRDLVQTIRVQAKDLDSPSAFEAAVKKAIPTEHLPTIFDKPVFNEIINIWRRQTDALPRYLGFGYLGWSHDRKKFNLPGTMLEIGKPPKIFTSPLWHPNAEPLRDFAAVAYRPAKAPESFTMTEAFLLCAVAGAIARVHRSAAVPILWFPESARKMLTDLFLKTTGQLEPLHVATNNRGQVKDIIFNGYPVLTNHSVRSMLEIVRWNAWVISDDPTARHDVESTMTFFTPEELSPEFIATFRQTIRETPGRVLKNPTESMPSVDPLYSLLREGMPFTPHGCSFAPRYPLLDELFESISLGMFKEFVTYDIRKHTINIELGGFSDERLLLEASVFTGRDTYLEDDVLILPEIPAVQMISNYYGIMPKATVVS